MTAEAVKKKILVVDDDAMAVTLMSQTLVKMGFEVLKGSNGHEALAIIRQNPVDLVILDQMMPKMNGIKACALIKADRRYRSIPVIMFTASADEADRQISQQVGANAFCNKPLNIPILTQKIQELLKI
ncbi:MAG: response regulator [Candidatus Omnitrophica bacterium]|nr:response regulator [Candidatus Omnitrophota bacterium]